MTIAAVEPPDEPPEDDATRPSPSDVGAEAAMLSAVVVVGQTDTAAAHQLVDELATLVEPGDMWHTGHFLLWQVLIDATAAGDPLDPASVHGRLLATGNPRARETAQQVLPNLLGRLAAAGSATHHARKVARCAVRRRLIETGTQLVQRAYNDAFDEQHDVPPVMAALEHATVGRSTQHAVPVSQVVERAVDLIEHPEHVDVIPSGLHDLDMIYPGLRPGQLVVIGARPSIGKSVVGLTLAEQAAVRLNRFTLLFSAEMNRLEVTQRLLASRASVDLGKVLNGSLNDADWVRLAKHMQPVADAPLLIDDTSDLTIGHIRAQVRRAARKGLKAVVIDYLQLISVGAAESRQVGVDEVARQLKVLAGDVGVPIVLLSQLNRGPEQRHDKRPMMSDLRESGGIENHADVVLLLHRPDFYDRDDRPGEMDIFVPKQRNGRTGSATVAFQGHFARVSSMAMWDS